MSSSTSITDTTNDSMNEWFTVGMEMFDFEVMDFTVSGHETLTESGVLSTIVTTTTH